MSNNPVQTKLGFVGLAALVFGMMVGAGIFNIPQNMAAGAGLGAVIISWCIIAVGMFFLVYTFKILADKRPDLDAGVYEYAQVGFGNYAGFNIAWGYWLCTSFSNVAYAVMLNDAVGAFFPSLLSHGWQTMLFGSVLIWGMCMIVSCGLNSSKLLTTLLAIVKILMILMIIALLAINFSMGAFTSDFWGDISEIGSVGSQIESTMLVTLWCFIGIEGAVIMASRAKRRKDVGRAGITGFLVAWVLYLLVSIFSFGVMSRIELSNLENPSAAYILKYTAGNWAYWLVIVSVIISIAGGWLAWTLVTAEVPFEAARVGIFPRRFMRLNRKGVPLYGLIVSSVVMQMFLLLVMLAEDVYLTALNIIGMMILPAYLVASLYLVKLSFSRESTNPKSATSNLFPRVVSICSALFCAWMLYAGNLTLLCQTSLFYLLGTGFYLKSRREKGPHEKYFSTRGLVILSVLILAAIYAIFFTQF